MAVRPTRDRDSGLTSLLADVLRSDASDAQLLVRYASDPDALDAEERAWIERELQGSAALRDQIRVLNEFDLAAALRAPVETPRAAGRAAATSATSPWQRLRASAWGRISLVALPLAAAALLAIVLLRSGAPELQPPGALAPGPIAQVEPLVPPTPTLPTLPEPVPGQPEAQPVEIAKAPTAKPEPAPAPKAEVEPPPPAPDYIAMAEVVYRAPSGAAALASEETYIRGADSGVTLAALAPRHVARTVSARPPLFWYLSALPEGSPSYAITIAGDDDVEPLVQTPLPAPTRPGLQRVALADLGTDLPLDKSLRWSIALKLDPENPSRDVIAQGAIERISEPAGLAAELEAAKPLDRASVFAAAGIWYDALAELERVFRDAPGEAVPRARLRSLLESAGIPDAARVAP